MRRRLVFVSTRFLFPIDSGGKIRTTQILRGMKGGEYEIVLLSPATGEQRRQHERDLLSVCDRFESWPAPQRGPAFHYTRGRYLLSHAPIPIATDSNADGAALIRRTLEAGADVAVFDFLHAAILAPRRIDVPSVLFTHNVEAEIFRRHLDNAATPLMRMLWKNQLGKMRRFEAAALQRFDVVVAVADRDAKQFTQDYGVPDAWVIPTGVDLEFFGYSPPDRAQDVVFCGSMDWLANQDAVDYFLDEIWPLVEREEPEARFTVVGRAPPQRLVEKAARAGLRCRFTGFVEDVRPYIAGAGVSVIPLRIGGGTRLKAYESLAMGTPLVSTTIGVEGLPLQASVHFVQADEPEAFADSVLTLMRSESDRHRISRCARDYVEANFSHTVAAGSFADACRRAEETVLGRAQPG